MIRENLGPLWRGRYQAHTDRDQTIGQDGVIAGQSPEAVGKAHAVTHGPTNADPGLQQESCAGEQAN